MMINNLTQSIRKVHSVVTLRFSCCCLWLGCVVNGNLIFCLLFDHSSQWLVVWLGSVSAESTTSLPGASEDYLHRSVQANIGKCFDSEKSNLFSIVSFLNCFQYWLFVGLVHLAQTQLLGSTAATARRKHWTGMCDFIPFPRFVLDYSLKLFLICCVLKSFRCVGYFFADWFMLLERPWSGISSQQLHSPVHRLTCVRWTWLNKGVQGWNPWAM